MIGISLSGTNRQMKILRQLMLSTFTADEIVRVCIRMTALCFFVTIILTWPLWFTSHKFLLTAPTLPWFGNIPDSVSMPLALSVLGVCALLFIAPRYRRFCFYPPVVFFVWVAQDEIRWQPFLYMYVFTLLFLGMLPKKFGDEDLHPMRFMVAGIYFWAGVYKINEVFIRMTFPWFVRDWITNPQLTVALGTITPLFEAAIGVSLLYPATRKLGVMGATVMLTVVLFSIGPLGHNWGIVVWPWNVMIDVLAVALFWSYQGELVKPQLMRNKLSVLAVVLFIALPVLGTEEYWGNLPSFKLYCGCTPELEIQFDRQEDLSFLPEKMAVHVDDKNRLAMIFVTATLFNVANTTSMPHSTLFRKSAQGFCPYLRKPESAQLVYYNPPNLWSIDYQPTYFPLCPDAQKNEPGKK